MPNYKYILDNWDNFFYIFVDVYFSSDKSLEGGY